jgi:hypothetical protein
MQLQRDGILLLTGNQTLQRVRASIKNDGSINEIA